MKNKYITWVEISKSALQHNIRQFNRILGPKTAFMAVVKSNAYGHGMIQIAKIAQQAGVKWFGTVSLDEALELRKHNIQKKILVLSFYNPLKLAEAIQDNISLTVYSYAAAKKINNQAKRVHKKASVHIKIDTGTSRLGIRPEFAAEIIKKIAVLPNIKIQGIFSHFADAENPNQKVTYKQNIVFNKVIKDLKKINILFPIQHIACSAATFLAPQTHNQLARIGISLYGLWSIEPDGALVRKLHKKIMLKPVLSWHTKIIQIKKVPKGATIGYGCSYKSKRSIVLALIPVGYWDGYDRKLSNCGEVLIHNKRCKIRCRICMNFTMVEVTGIRNMKTGDKVTLIGGDSSHGVTVEELARHIKTINYEITTRINPLLPRIITQ